MNHACSKVEARVGTNFAERAIAVHSEQAILHSLSTTRLVNERMENQALDSQIESKSSLVTRFIEFEQIEIE